MDSNFSEKVCAFKGPAKNICKAGRRIYLQPHSGEGGRAGGGEIFAQHNYEYNRCIQTVLDFGCITHA